MKRGARACRFVVNEKLCVQHAKSITFKDEYLISFSQSVGGYIDSAKRQVLLR